MLVGLAESGAHLVELRDRLHVLLTQPSQFVLARALSFRERVLEPLDLFAERLGLLRSRVERAEALERGLELLLQLLAVIGQNAPLGCVALLLFGERGRGGLSVG